MLGYAGSCTASACPLYHPQEFGGQVSHCHHLKLLHPSKTIQFKSKMVNQKASLFCCCQCSSGKLVLLFLSQMECHSSSDSCSSSSSLMAASPRLTLLQFVFYEKAVSGTSDSLSSKSPGLSLAVALGKSGSPSRAEQLSAEGS